MTILKVTLEILSELETNEFISFILTDSVDEKQ